MNPAEPSSPQESASDVDRLLAEFLAGAMGERDVERLLLILREDPVIRRDLCSLLEIDCELGHLARTRQEVDRSQAAQLVGQIEKRLGSDARLLEMVLTSLEPQSQPASPERSAMPGFSANTPVVTRRSTKPWWIAIPIAACLALTFTVILHHENGMGPAHPKISSPVTLAFQDGSLPTVAYSGTRDTWINNEHPSTRYGAEAVLEVEDSEGKPGGRPALLRWDMGVIPQGSRVLSATVTLDITKASGGRTCLLYEVKRDWSESQANWSHASPAGRWEIPGAQGPRDRGGMILGSFLPRPGSCAIELGPEGRNVIQSWIDQPESNHGLLFVLGESEGKFAFRSRESTEPEGRPRLTVMYRPPE